MLPGCWIKDYQDVGKPLPRCWINCCNTLNIRTLRLSYNIINLYYLNKIYQSIIENDRKSKGEKVL